MTANETIRVNKVLKEFNIGMGTLVEFLNKKGIAIEANGSCFISRTPENLKNCEYVRVYSIAKECGCKFTYGSDSHGVTSKRDLPVVEQFLAQCGITNDDFLRIEDFKRK